MSRIQIIAVGVVALLVIAAVTIGNTPAVAPVESPAGSIAREDTAPSVTSSASLRATMGASQKPTQTPSATVLLTFKGRGTKSSGPFTASGDSADLTYTFDCSALDSAGTFALTFFDQNGVDMDSWKVRDRSGKDTTRVYISNTVLPYHLEVTSECSWVITVTGTP